MAKAKRVIGAAGPARLRPIGFLTSELASRSEAPRQGAEGAPDAWLEVEAWAADGLLGISPGDALVVLTWLHEARREVLRVHPRGDRANTLAGVFATRSPDRPNPIGLHEVTVRAIDGRRRLRVGPIEAIDGTPVVDLKPVLRPAGRRQGRARRVRSAATRSSSAAAGSRVPGPSTSSRRAKPSG